MLERNRKLPVSTFCEKDLAGLKSLPVGTDVEVQVVYDPLHDKPTYHVISLGSVRLKSDQPARSCLKGKGDVNFDLQADEARQTAFARTLRSMPPYSADGFRENSDKELAHDQALAVEFLADYPELETEGLIFMGERIRQVRLVAAFDNSPVSV